MLLSIHYVDSFRCFCLPVHVGRHEQMDSVCDCILSDIRAFRNLPRMRISAKLQSQRHQHEIARWHNDTVRYAKGVIALKARILDAIVAVLVLFESPFYGPDISYRVRTGIATASASAIWLTEFGVSSASIYAMMKWKTTRKYQKVHL